MKRSAFEVVKFVGVYGSVEESSVCFAQEEDAILYVQKYLGGKGCIRFRDVGHNKKIYKTIDEFEDEYEWGLC